MEWTVSRRINLVKKEPRGNDARPHLVDRCPLTAAWAAIGGKWKLILVYWLAQSPRYFAALREAVPGISQKVLTEQLRELIADGIVRWQPTSLVPAPVEYSLTDYGRPVVPVMETMRCWGSGHLQRRPAS